MQRKRNSMGRYDSRPTAPVLERFERQFTRVPESGCWLWTGASNGAFGYGSFKLGNRESKVLCAHRAAWMLYVGEIPTGQCVCHSCDVPACVNPAHLFLGTHKDNVLDKMSKGRGIIGEQCHMAKLTTETVRTIKAMNDKPTKVLAALFGVSRQSVADIIYGRTWKHVQAAA